MSSTSTADIPYLGIAQLGALLRSRLISSLEVTRLLLDRISSIDAQLQSYSHVSGDLAVEGARRADLELRRGIDRGPLHGVPVAIKDLCDVEGMPTGAGMVLSRDISATADAEVVHRLKDAGAVILGKLEMTEGGFSAYHPSIAAPINPWSRQLWSGVSSSGCGVATAAGLCFGSIATDTGGSVRWPSAANGVTGLKPTWGRLSTRGVVPCSPSLDTVGLMARSALDCELMMNSVVTSKEEAGSMGVPPKFRLDGLRVGLDQSYAFRGADEDTQRAVQTSLDLLVSAGATLQSFTMPDTRHVLPDILTIVAVESVLAHSATYPSRSAEYGPRVKAIFESATRVSPDEKRAVDQRRDEFRHDLQVRFREIDILVTPVQCFATPLADHLARQDDDPDQLERLARFTCPFNLTGNPTLTLPAGESGGAPLGVQFVGRLNADELLLCVGKGFQHCSSWHTRHPPA